MVKLEIALDPKDALQMRALSTFASMLGGEPGPAAETENPQGEEPVGPTETAKPKKRAAAKPKEEKPEGEAKEPAEQPTESGSKITLDDIRRVVAEKKEKHFQIMKFTLKQDFGVSKTPDLKEEQYEAFYNFVNGL